MNGLSTRMYEFIHLLIHPSMRAKSTDHNVNLSRAVCFLLFLVCPLVVRRVRSAMAEEEEEAAAAATLSLREQGNIHNASFTAETNLL